VSTYDGRCIVISWQMLSPFLFLICSLSLTVLFMFGARFKISCVNRKECSTRGKILKLNEIPRLKFDWDFTEILHDWRAHMPSHWHKPTLNYIKLCSYSWIAVKEWLVSIQLCYLMWALQSCSISVKSQSNFNLGISFNFKIHG